MGKLVDHILAKGRGNIKPLKPKSKPQAQQANFKYNLDPVQNNPIDVKNRERIVNDPSRAAQDPAANRHESVNINDTTLSLVTELERKFELSFDNLAKLLGLNNGKIDIRYDGVHRKLLIDYTPNGIKADNVINDDDVNKADDKRPV